MWVLKKIFNIESKTLSYEWYSAFNKCCLLEWISAFQKLYNMFDNEIRVMSATDLSLNRLLDAKFWNNYELVFGIQSDIAGGLTVTGKKRMQNYIFKILSRLFSGQPSLLHLRWKQQLRHTSGTRKSNDRSRRSNWEKTFLPRAP